MGQVALGFRSLLLRALMFFIMAALLAWALGGTLWPTPVCRSLESIQFGERRWIWKACLDPSPVEPGDSPLKYVLIYQDREGDRTKLPELEGRMIVDTLPLVVSDDRLVVFASERDGGKTTWRKISVSSTGKVVADEKLVNRLAAVESWSALSTPAGT